MWESIFVTIFHISKLESYSPKSIPNLTQNNRIKMNVEYLSSIILWYFEVCKTLFYQLFCQLWSEYCDCIKYTLFIPEVQLVRQFKLNTCHILVVLVYQGDMWQVIKWFMWIFKKVCTDCNCNYRPLYHTFQCLSSLFLICPVEWSDIFLNLLYHFHLFLIALKMLNGCKCWKCWVD